MTRDSGSLGRAVYFDPDVPASAVAGLDKASAVVPPLSTIAYPDTSYFYDATRTLPSQAETISFWIAADTSAGANGRYALYRRANNQPPTVVARGLILPPTSVLDPLPFTYYTTDSLGKLKEIPAASLPWYHRAALHGSPSDTGMSARTDSIRVVRVHLVGMYLGAKSDTTPRRAEMKSGASAMSKSTRSTAGYSQPERHLASRSPASLRASQATHSQTRRSPPGSR